VIREYLEKCNIASFRRNKGTRSQKLLGTSRRWNISGKACASKAYKKDIAFPPEDNIFAFYDT
jgi:hypothetical protein